MLEAGAGSSSARAAFAALLLGELERLAPVFSSAGVEFLAFKGAALLAGGWRTPLERGLSDIDLLVRPEGLNPAREVLLASGYGKMEGSSFAFIKAGPAGATVIADLHHWLDYRADCGPVFDRAVAVRLGGTVVKVPCAEEHALLICAHSLLHHARLSAVAFEDVGALSRRDGFSWKLLEEVTLEAGAGELVSAAFSELVRRGLSVPEWFMQEVRPRSVRGRLRSSVFAAACHEDSASAALEYLLPHIYSPRNIVRYARARCNRA